MAQERLSIEYLSILRLFWRVVVDLALRAVAESFVTRAVRISAVIVDIHAVHPHILNSFSKMHTVIGIAVNR